MVINKHTTCPDPDSSGREGHDYTEHLLTVQIPQNVDVLPHGRDGLVKQFKI